MKKIYNFIVGFVIVVFANGCYDDKGNYDYRSVNDLEIEIPEAKVRMPKTDTVVVTLTPKLTQTLVQSETNLAFEWFKLNGDAKIGSERITDYEPYSTSRACDVKVEPNNPESIGMMLIVTDAKTGQKWYKLGKVAVIKPLNPAWIVLQESATQQAMVGAVEGDADGFFAYTDVFKSETGKPLTLAGKPVAIAARGQYGYRQPPFTTTFANLTIATNREITTFDPSTMKIKYGTNKILFENALKSIPVNLSYYRMEKKGEVFVTDKKAYFAYDDGYCVPYSIFDTRVEGENTKREIFRPSCLVTFGSYALVYNPETKSFRIGNIFSSMNDYVMTSFYKSKFIRSGSQWKDNKPLVLRALNEDTEGNYAFDPHHIDEANRLLDIVNGGSGSKYAYAMMTTDGSSMLTVYMFSADYNEPMCKGKYSISLPPTIDLGTACFAASSAFSAHFVFMAAGNSVYRIDMERQKVEVIYTYEMSTSAKIACLKFRDANDSDNGLGMILGFGVNTDNGKGYIGELRLNVAGDVERAEKSSFIFDDPANSFGKIIDITYNHE